MPYAPYTATLNTAFKHIDTLVKTASSGNMKVIIGGQSMEAAVAYLYCAAVNVQRAQKLVMQGKGNITNTFTDYNQGDKSSIQAKADVYLSYFDPARFNSDVMCLSFIIQSLPAHANLTYYSKSNYFQVRPH